jgi:hypothetical protein
MGTKSNYARTLMVRGRKGPSVSRTAPVPRPRRREEGRDDLAKDWCAASWRDGSGRCDSVARPWPQDSDLLGRALGALSERPFDAVGAQGGLLHPRILAFQEHLTVNFRLTPIDMFSNG